MSQTVEVQDLEELLARYSGGKFDAAVGKGRVFSQTTTPLGLAIPIYSATAIAGNVIWNPPGSGVAARMLRYNFGRTSGAAAFAAIGLSVREEMGADIATGSEITAFAQVVPTNALVGAGNKSKVRSSNAGTTTITAGVAAEFIHEIGVMTPEVDATTNAPRVNKYDFDGLVTLMPGTLAWVTATKASVALFSQSLIWEEVPLSELSGA